MHKWVPMQEICIYCSMNKQYVEGVQKWKRGFLDGKENGQSKDRRQYYIAIMSRHDTFLQKYISFFITSRKVQKLAVGMCERDRDKGHGHRLTEACYINPYLLNNIDSIFRAPLTTFAASQLEVPSLLHRRWCPMWLLPWFGCDFNWLTVTDHWYLCICNFIALKHSSSPSGCQPTWSAYTHALLVFQ